MIGTRVEPESVSRYKGSTVGFEFKTGSNGRHTYYVSQVVNVLSYICPTSTFMRGHDWEEPYYLVQSRVRTRRSSWQESDEKRHKRMIRRSLNVQKAASHCILVNINPRRARARARRQLQQPSAPSFSPQKGCCLPSACYSSCRTSDCSAKVS